MATNPQAFYCLWRDETIRERLFELLSNQDICAVRLASSACCNLVTKRLFLRTHLTFTANTLTKPSRLDALSRIGHHIEHLTFYFPHSNATFLPPVIHPQSGEEIHFLYNPHTSAASALTKAKYDNSELGEILTQQYPPLFHAATHVPSFINALHHMTNMRHLTIKTPGQDPRERYRRDVVDYALTSLRIAVERAPLHKLSKLSLSGVHPSAFTYLRHIPGLGASPSASLRWRQIRKLYVAVDSWDFYGPAPGLDHLKIIEDFIRAFAPRLDKFSFTWLGRRGPCPIALSDDPLFAPPRSSKKLFNEVTGPMSPLPAPPARRPLVMPRLRALSVRNATMNVPQLRDLVAGHKHSVREFDFENVALIKGGSWDEALAPLTEGGEGDAWSRRSAGARDSGGSGDGRPGTSRSNSSGSAVASSVEDEHLPASSAAATAASRELFEVDLEGMVFGGVNDVDTFEAGVEEWAKGVSDAAAAAQDASRPNTSSGARPESDGGLASDIEAARLASEGFSTKLKKRRMHKRSSRKHDEEGFVEEEEHRRASDYHRTSERRPEIYRHDSQHSQRRPDIQRQDSQLSQQSHRSHHSDRSQRSHHHSRSHHKHSRSDDTSDRISSRAGSHRSHRATPPHHRHHSEDLATPVVELPLFMPEVIGTDDEAACYYSPPARSPHSPRSPPTPRSPPQPQTPGSPHMDISVPILNPDPLPVMLQPTVYDPSVKCGPFVRTPPPLSRSNTSSSSASGMSGVDSLLSSAQRSIEADMLAEAQEAAARASALQRAKQAVITKLSREFSKRSRDSDGKRGNKDSAAVLASLSTLNLGLRMDGLNGGSGGSAGGGGGGGQHHSGLSCASSTSVGYRLREGLFGRSLANVAIAPDHRSLESQSALVPLIFSRS